MILKMSKNALKFFCTSPKEKNYSIESKILDMINSAQKKIFICCFLINSEPIVDALLTKASQLKGHIYILTAINENYIKYFFNEELEPLYEKYNFRALERLSGNDQKINSATAIRGHKNAHAKFLIVDNKEAFITSANFTKSSFREVPEVGVYSDNPNIVKPLIQLFSDFYLKRYRDLQGFKNSPIRNYSVYRYLENFQLPIYSNFFNNKDVIEYPIWTYDFDNKPISKDFENCAIKKSILQLLTSEKKQIDIFTYSFKNLESSEILTIIKNKLENENVKVRILTFDHKQSSNSINYLLNSIKIDQSLDIRTYKGFHAKGLIISNEVLLSTANFDGKLGLNGDFEVGIVSKDKLLRIEVQNFFNYYFNLGIKNNQE